MVTGWTDTHAHLYASEFDPDREEVIHKARVAGIQRILLPNIDVQSTKGLLDLVNADPVLFKGMMGLHPCSVREDFRVQLEMIHQFLQERKDYLAIGEIGMDLYWDTSTRGWQEEAFCTQCEWAASIGLPVAIHSREATIPLIELLEQHRHWGIRGVFHCFSGTAAEAERIIDLGFYLGIGGVLTFKNSGLRECLKAVPLDSVVLETDSPYLAPAPHRGKRNEPGYIPIIGEVVASIYNVPLEVIASKTTENANRLFSV